MTDLGSNVAAFTFEVEGLTQELRVIRFNGNEALSQLYWFGLELAAEDSEIEFSAVVGKAGLLTLYGEDGGIARQVHGIVSRFEQAEQGRRFTTYYAAFVPLVWVLTHRYDCRIFQGLNVPDIVKQVLEDAGIPADQFRFSLQETYEPLEYCVQYRESDFNFVSRLLEAEGIFYYFEHGEEGAAFVMADSPAAHEGIAEPATVLFHERTGMVAGEDHVYSFRYAENVQPGGVALNDYNFKKPALSLLSEEKAEDNPPLARYDYPGVFETPEHGGRLASVRLEELQGGQKLGMGEGVCRRLVSGYKFTLSGHPRSSFDQEYVLTGITQTGAQPQALEEGAPGEGSTYSNQFECIPADVSYRPPRLSRKPVIEGTQTAIVVGPQGEEIYTDEFGRVKVQFHWDRDGAHDENSSCWIRVSQPWTGAAWGAVYIPRVGQEVVINFLEGDPDRPLITGCLYHGTNRPPYKLPDEKTKSGIKSNSSTGGDGFNEIRFEDKKDDEQVFLHAEKNLDVRVKSDRFETIGHDRHLVVENDKKEHVKNERHEVVDSHHYEKIGGDLHLTVAGKEAVGVDGSLSLTVSGDVAEVFKGDYSEQVTGDAYIKAANIVIEAMTNITVKVGQSYIAIESGGIKIGTTGEIVLDAMGNITLDTMSDIGQDAMGNIGQNAMGNVTIEGMGNASLKGLSGTKVESPAITEVTGTLVKIN